MEKTYGIHWFRRDLRVAGNLGLQENWKRHQGRVVGVFCFDKEFLSRPDFSVNRFQFFIETLISLQKELRSNGSDLLFMDTGPLVAFPELLKKLKDKQGEHPSLVTWGRDYEPYARQRDQKMAELFSEYGIATQTVRDHLLIEPTELGKKDNPDAFYQVYSPFARQWLNIFETTKIQDRLKQQTSGMKYLKKAEKGEFEKTFSLTWNELLKDQKDYEKILQDYKTKNGKKVTVAIPPAGSVEGFKKLKSFFKNVDSYKDKRDFPAVDATSGFSVFLKNGSLTVPQIITQYKLQRYKKKKTSQDSFFSELIWREFYYHILYHCPHVETEPFLSQYKNIAWENNKDWFKAWKDGETGFPIVDAGMRQLKTTGWMHNRVRMIVASFLTKDLLIDWRWGEKYFMEVLLDGDVAPNNGGWQWAASTGCDPQPYFRIFNPWLQSKKFDPEGEYIKTYIPELRELEAKKLHQPILGHAKYPEPICEHSEQRDKALQMYKVVRSSP